MANLVITTSTNTINITSNDLTTNIGFNSVSYNKSSINLEMNYGNTDVLMNVSLVRTLRLSYNGSQGSFQVDSVDGVTPNNNIESNYYITTITTSCWRW